MHDTASMTCPSCAVTLTSERVDGVQIDRCPDCGGVWLEQGELEILRAEDDRGLADRIVQGLRQGEASSGPVGSVGNGSGF
jgi:Zn-finger nucleic acid-binding protein